MCKQCGDTTMQGSFYCEPCFDKRVSKIELRDVETYDEDRYLFLVRTARKLGIERTHEEIKQMIEDGYTDSIILNDKPLKLIFKENYGLQRFI